MKKKIVKHCLSVLRRQGISACSPDERRYRDMGEAAKKRHSHRQQLRNLQSQRTQPYAELRVRHSTHLPLQLLYKEFASSVWPLIAVI